MDTWKLELLNNTTDRLKRKIKIKNHVRLTCLRTSQCVIFLLHQQLRLLTRPSTMEALNPATPYTPKSANPSPQTPSPSASPSPLASSSSRLWRPTAQRNLRNQWSKLASLRQEWASSSSTGRVNAMSLVNAYLSMKYYSHPSLCYIFILFFSKIHFFWSFVWCVCVLKLCWSLKFGFLSDTCLQWSWGFLVTCRI